MLTNQNGCDSTIIQTTTLAPLQDCDASLSLEENTLQCDETTSSFTVMVNQGAPPFELTWTGPNSGTQTIQNLAEATNIDNLPAGDYSIVLTDNYGYSNAYTWTFTPIFAPEIDAIATTFGDYNINCIGEATGSASVEIINGAAPFSYLWSTDATTNTIENLSAATYTVTVTDFNNCSTSTSVTLIEPETLEMAFEITDLACFEENSGMIGAVVTGGQAPYSYQLNDGIPQPNNTFSGLSAGTYTLTISDANGCSASEAIFINVPIAIDISLGEDLYIDLGESTTINAFVNVPMENLATITWDGMSTETCENCLEQVVTPIITTTYTIYTVGQNGCNDQDQLTVFVDKSTPVYAPNAFSPNGDGENDVFLLFANEQEFVKINELSIFSRWGELVFKSENTPPNSLTHGWDGTFRGEALQPAVFIWCAVVELYDGSTKVLKGDVTLVK